MKRFEIIGQIVTHLQTLDDEALQALLTQLQRTRADKTADFITYGADDTEHSLSSSRNAEDLNQAMQELAGQDLLMPKSEYAA